MGRTLGIKKDYLAMQRQIFGEGAGFGEAPQTPSNFTERPSHKYFLVKLSL